MCHSTQGTCGKWSYESAYIGCKSRSSPIPTALPTESPTRTTAEIARAAEDDAATLGNNEQQLGTLLRVYLARCHFLINSCVEDIAYGLGFDTTKCHLPHQFQSRTSCSHQVAILVATTAMSCVFVLWVTYRALRSTRIHDTYSEIEEEEEVEEEDDEYGVGSLTDDALFFFSGQSSNSNRMFEGI
jgi:hypothetical protein